MLIRIFVHFTQIYTKLKFRSNILKVALFATGLAGIVAEYILATLASHFLGNSTFQWIFILSTMLFAMGLGSRLSKLFTENLLETFIYLEIALSLLVSFSAIATYLMVGYQGSVALMIYVMGIIIGLFIGMEIPLVVRLNESNQTLRYNISSALENDYYGSLVGGLFFVFIGLPYIGLIHTPFILGCVNLLIAIFVYIVYKNLQINKPRVIGLLGFSAVCIAVGAAIAKPIVMHGEQQRYKDLIVLSKQSAYQKIVVTKWKNNYWLYLDGNQQLSTLDEVMYHEPLVHPAMQLMPHAKEVLVLGGGDGCAVREIIKYDNIQNITVVDLDSAVTNLAKLNPIFLTLNDSSFYSPKVTIVNTDAFTWLENTSRFFDIIIIDLPDPKTIELARLYSAEYYAVCHKHLRPQGVLVTQAGSPYFATKAFLCIDKTMQYAGFKTAKYHNQIITMGEWGWILGVKGMKDSICLKSLLMENTYENIHTRWISKEANMLLFSFGKNYYIGADTANINVNKIHNSVLQQYYLDGNWDIY